MDPFGNFACDVLSTSNCWCAMATNTLLTCRGDTAGSFLLGLRANGTITTSSSLSATAQAIQLLAGEIKASTTDDGSVHTCCGAVFCPAGGTYNLLRDVANNATMTQSHAPCLVGQDHGNNEVMVGAPSSSPPGCRKDATRSLPSPRSADCLAVKPPNAPKRPAPAITLLHITELQLACAMSGMP